MSESTTDKKTVSTVWGTNSKAKKTRKLENELFTVKVAHHLAIEFDSKTNFQMRNGAKNQNVPTRNANAIRRSVCIDQDRHKTRHRLFS